MTERETDLTTTPSLSDILSTIPGGSLDSPEIEGGLTWRQSIIIGITRGYSRLPEDEQATLPYNPRVVIRKSVDEAIQARIADTSVSTSAREAIILGLEVAEDGYARLCETDPAWLTDKSVVQDLLALWQREDSPYITEELASNALYQMYPPEPVS